MAFAGVLMAASSWMRVHEATARQLEMTPAHGRSRFPGDPFTSLHFTSLHFTSLQRCKYCENCKSTLGISRLLRDTIVPFLL